MRGAETDWMLLLLLGFFFFTAFCVYFVYKQLQPKSKSK